VPGSPAPRTKPAGRRGRPKLSVLRWGILGAARIAPRIVRAIEAEPRGELLAVASRDLDRARAFATMHRIPAALGSYEELLATRDIDVVYIALPNHLHAPWTIRALEAGKHVLCEKPLALRASDVDAIAAAATAAGRIAVEAFMYLHHPQIATAVDIARSGRLGRVGLVTGTFTFFLDGDADPRADPAMGGGSIWDVGCYPVSFARRVIGTEPTEARAFAHLDARGIDRTFVGQLRFPGDVFAQFDSGFEAPFRERAEIVGSEASLVLDAPFLSTPDGPAPSLVEWRGDVATAIEVPAVDQVHLQVADLTAAVLDGRAPRVDLPFSRGSIAALEALVTAARSSEATPVAV
jgi:D-xylose 1-dehydrogenase (NADP+, D-xylono-1,5-lactone-forming)